MDVSVLRLDPTILLCNYDTVRCSEDVMTTATHLAYETLSASKSSNKQQQTGQPENEKKDLNETSCTKSPILCKTKWEIVHSIYRL